MSLGGYQYLNTLIQMSLNSATDYQQRDAKTSRARCDIYGISPCSIRAW